MPSYIESARVAIKAMPGIKTGEITPNEAEKAAEAISNLIRRTPQGLINMLIEGYGLVSRLRSHQEDKPIALEDPRTIAAFKTIFGYLKNADPRVPPKFIEHQIMSPGVMRGDVMYRDRIRHQKEAELKIKIPWAMIINSTSECNLRPVCNGCYAAKHVRGIGLSFNELDRLTGEAEDLGISAIVWSGGEPLIREKDILEVARRHPRQNYAVFTNATRIHENTAEKFLETGTNTVFFVHLQGGRESTEAYMGKTVYDRSLQGMEYLKKARFPFGFSITVNRDNFDEVTNRKYLKFLKHTGCRFGIFFPYIPVGDNPNQDLMLTDDQENRLKQVTNRMRRKGFLVFSPEDLMSKSSGCIAGTGNIAITSTGELEPCVFIHASDKNVLGKPLADALVTSKLIQGCQKAQENDRSCLLRERPEVLAEIINNAGASSTEI